jgi:hypothetical protein
MRRTLFSVLALGMLGLSVGCKTSSTHGVCDCEVDDHCATRQPWVAHGPGAAPHGTSVGTLGAPLPTGTPVNGAPVAAPLPNGAPTTAIPAATMPPVESRDLPKTETREPRPEKGL